MPLPIDRRRFLLLSGGALALPVLEGRVAFAAPDAPRLVVVNLRGGLDGLAAVAPYGDPDYGATRQKLAMLPPGEQGGLFDLDGFFGLHPALAHCASLYARGEMLPVIGVASPYRARSHFDAQDMLANGTIRTAGRNGWLNRALVEMNRGGESPAMSVGTLVPLMLRGEAPVSSWMPAIGEPPGDDFLALMDRLYAADPKLAAIWRESRSAASSEAMKTLQGADGPPEFEQACTVAAQLLSEPAAPRVISLELSGWDTHAGQGAADGRLAALLARLDRGLATLTREIPAGRWAKTVILVVSEFGRTVHMNGTGGTDHGTAGAALVLGGAVKGGAVLHDWRGLETRHLHEGRDLYPAIDIRSVFKGVLHAHMGIDAGLLERRIFPESGTATLHSELIRI